MALNGQAALISIRTSKATALIFPFVPSGLHRELDRENGRTVERIRFRAFFDATDGLERNLPAAVRHGVRPELAALELLMKEGRPLLFVWGDRKSLVEIEALTVREHEFDRQLNPIRAVVRIQLVVGADMSGAAAASDVGAPAVAGSGGVSGWGHAGRTTPARTSTRAGKSGPRDVGSAWAKDVEEQYERTRAALAGLAMVDVQWTSSANRASRRKGSRHLESGTPPARTRRR